MRVKDAIEEYGTREAMCNALGIVRMNASYWGYWVPKNHATSLSVMNENLTYDKELYEGKKFIEAGGIKWKIIPSVTTTAKLNIELKKGAKLFFAAGAPFGIVNATLLDKELLNIFFRKYPLYTVA